MIALQQMFLHLVLLLDAGLDQAQIVGLEALETAVRPLALVVLAGVLISAWLNLATGLSRVSAQLVDQVVHIKSSGLVEEAHLVQDALHVARILILELPLLEVFHLRSRNVQLGHALTAVLHQILSSLYTPVGQGLLG